MERISSVAQDAQFIFKTTEFVRDTTVESGVICMVVDEATDKVEKYCVSAFGRWRDL